jgi:hypothetical protein
MNVKLLPSAFRFLKNIHCEGENIVFKPSNAANYNDKPKRWSLIIIDTDYLYNESCRDLVQASKHLNVHNDGLGKAIVATAIGINGIIVSFSCINIVYPKGSGHPFILPGERYALMDAYLKENSWFDEKVRIVSNYFLSGKVYY